MNTAKIQIKTPPNNATKDKGHVSYYEANNTYLEIKAMVQNASDYIAPVWPLKTFIACNPLHGYESIHIKDALNQASLNHLNSNHYEGLGSVNSQMIKWCGLYLDEGQSTIQVPFKNKGFYLSFLNLAPFDKTLHQNNSKNQKFLQELPSNPSETIALCLLKLNIPKAKIESFMTQTLLYLPGWAGFVKWHADWNNDKCAGKNKITMTEFLAIRLVITYLLWPDAKIALNKDNQTHFSDKVIKQLTLNESQYRQQILKSLVPQIAHFNPKAKRQDASLVFCIDVRSEPFRQSIEQLGNYDTFGFAGFFGIPVTVKEIQNDDTKACCPVLLKPRFEVKEVVPAKYTKALKRYQKGKNQLRRYKKIYQSLKHNFSTPFALVESMGFWCGLNMLLKSTQPLWAQSMTKGLKNFIAPKPQTLIAYHAGESDLIQGLSLKEQVTYANLILRLMGLTSGFAKLIILCGHGSTTENNPYASALDCGACGGNHGDINARLLATILNKSEIRQGLEEFGIHIPIDTQFFGGLHNTTTDEVKLEIPYDATLIYPELLQKLKQDLLQAQVLTHQKRSSKLNHASSKDIIKKSLDWSETRPEWGLARNAAFIVGPRDITRHINLEGRCFLHSYRYEQDEEGQLLETILTAPMVVAQWINTQYLFSTLDNVAFGSGSKITHNVVGKIGVMQGNESDLMNGLPLQSVMKTDHASFHELQRLLTIVYAPPSLVLKIVEKHSILKNLFFNEWVQLIAIDPLTQLPYKLNASKTWEQIDLN